MTEKGPSPFNPRSQMAHFLRRMGFIYSEPYMYWQPEDRTPTKWTQEELERWWAEAHSMRESGPI